MTNFELILRKIQNWELGNARQEMSIALELDDAQIQQLDTALREYQYVADNIEAVRGELSTNPVKALRALDDLPEIKNTHPVYEKLRADAVEQVRLQQRTEVLKHIAEAEDLSQTVKSWSEARAILEDVKLTYPNWGADQEIKRNLLQAENEADKAQRSDSLLQEFSKQISLGKPDRCNEIVNELEILGKVIPEELKNKRQEANRIAAHKQGRSSKDTKDFSEAKDDIAHGIASLPVRLGVIQDKNACYDLTVEDDVLLADEAHDALRIGMLIRRVVHQADQCEQRHLPEQDAAMVAFRSGLEKESSDGV